MSDSLRKSFDRFKKTKPKTRSFSHEASVDTSWLGESERSPLVITPAVEGIALNEWVELQREFIDEKLTLRGAILFRRFGLSQISDFNRLVTSLSPQLMSYEERSTPRSDLGDGVYTSTEYPADEVIPMHNELSYGHMWPLRIMFFCVQPAASEGTTPIADSRRVFAEIDPAVRDEFTKKRILYVRNFGEDGLGMTWQTVFQTSDRSEVESYCRKAGIDFEWLGENRLRTRALRPAVARHPKTKEWIWFNQAHLHHISSLRPEAQENLLAVVEQEDLPFNTYYGDGSPISDAALTEVRRAYDECSLTFPWSVGDLLLLDNMLFAHGRSTYTGERKVVVAMADLCGQYGLDD